MSLDGHAALRSLYHDLIESVIHQIDKALLGERKEVIYIAVPAGQEFAFENSYPGLDKSGVYLLGPEITTRPQGDEIADWDREGTLASFSIGSEVSGLRQLFIDEERHRRGPKGDPERKTRLPSAPPADMNRTFDPVVLREVSGQEYLGRMLEVRELSTHYHCRALGEEKREYWKKIPVATRLVEGNDIAVGAFFDPIMKGARLMQKDDEAGMKTLLGEVESGAFLHALLGDDVPSAAEAPAKKKKKKVVMVPSDLRRYTVNAHPALARAMALMLEHGVPKEKVRELMVKTAPLMAAEFERITGRKIHGVSIHMDSNLPHWNLWHGGLEAVAYKVGKSEKVRFRRTAMNLNSSGNMLAWDRVARSFQRLGEDFRTISPTTAKELEKAEQRAQTRQDRSPGDFALNRKADKILEAALKEMKVTDIEITEVIDRGFREFVENERKRYAAAVAGRDPKDIKKMIDLLKLKGGETPLDATRRLVDERERIEKALEGVEPGDGDIVARIERINADLGVARDDKRKLRETLRPDGDETLADAARNVLKTVDSLQQDITAKVAQTEALQTDLAASQKQVGELEKEIGPLRRLAEMVAKFLKAMRKNPVKLGPNLMEMLKEIGGLVGVVFEIKKEKNDKAQQQDVV